jgi:gliding motility-associated-like protein
MAKPSLLLAMLLMIGQAASAQVNSGLLAHWTFDSTLNDSSGNGYHLQSHGRVAYGTGRFGEPNGAFSFTDTGTFLETVGPQIGNLQQYTLAFWFFSQASLDTMSIFSRCDHSQPNMLGIEFWQLPINTGRGWSGYRIEQPFSGGGCTTQPYNSVNQGYQYAGWCHCRWHLMVITYEPGMVLTSHDGAVYGISTWQNSASYTPCNSTIRIGADRLLNPNWFKGKVDDIRIYNRVLTQGEVSQLYNERITRPAMTDPCTDCAGSGNETTSDDLYFPDAITPNGDGKNDLFRAAYAPGFTVQSYELMIFNRWGQLVFRTNRLEAGWDGSIRGAGQGINTFAWFARYRRHAGEPDTLRKGTFVLLR